jgi:sugar/nucleoside kinase (ribokinase family)
MSDLDIYALGHALVDEEYAVTESFLRSLGISKNHRTLIDYQRSNSLRHSARDQGQLNIRSSGGSGANSIATAAQLGANCHFSCVLGNDEDGQFYHQELCESGIQPDDNPFRDGGHTGVCLVMLTPDAARTMNTYVGITDFIGPEDVNQDAILSSKWLYLEGHLLIAESGFHAALKARDIAREHGCKIAVNFCDPAVARLCRERLTQLLDEPVDLLLCNEEEAAIWAYEEDLNLAMDKIDALADTWVVTQGEDGATVFDGQIRHSVSALNVQAVSTLGAGDTFAGAFLYGIISNMNYVEAAELASIASAHLVQHAGPRLSKEQLMSIKTEHSSHK